MVEQMYNVKQVASLLAIKERTVHEWIKTGKLNAQKYPNCSMWFVAESELKRVQGRD